MKGTLFSCLLFVLVHVVIVNNASAAQFQPWSENLFLEVGRQFGEEAEKRYRYLHRLVLDNQNLPVMDKLELVNRTLNHLPWIADKEHWQKNDYWASPLETITTFGGDCEDIAIAKWALLRYLGISRDDLRLAYVKIKRSGENHMVLVYFDKDEKTGKRTAYVLDNYVDEVALGRERKDLLAIYLTDADGTVTLVADDGETRSVKAVIPDRKTKKMKDLQERMAQYHVEARKYNDGRPLLPEN